MSASPLTRLGALAALAIAAALPAATAETKETPAAERLVRLRHHTPGATTDLGVGLWGWPVPVDRNGDGLTDLVVVSSYHLKRGTYYFENTGRRDARGVEIFKPGVRLGDGRHNITATHLPDGRLKVLASGQEFPRFLETGADQPVPFPVNNKTVHPTSGSIRAAQYSLVDFHGRGRHDLIVGIGDWSDYGWEAAHDRTGRWMNGPLHGYVYLLENTGTDASPVFGKPRRLEADTRPIDVYGMPSPVFADFRGTGKLDLVCGEFVDGFTFFENIGTREQPRYAAGRRLRTPDGEPLRMPLTCIVVTAFDWNRDGRTDLVVAQEDGRVAWLENTGRMVDVPTTARRDGEPVKVPAFALPRFFRQEAHEVKFGVLATPAIADWDGDGRPDILSGNSAGEIGWIRNLGGKPVRWAEAQTLQAGGETIRFEAGPSGSIQGPAETKWGYTQISVGDWNGDGRPDVVASDITGRVYWFENLGGQSPGRPPRLAPARKIQVWWDGAPAAKPAWNWWDPADDELVAQWRCTPLLVTLPGEKSPGIVTVDHEGYLALFTQEIRDGERRVLPGRRVFKQANGRPLRATRGERGRSGRRTFAFIDWDRDGRLDLLMNWGPNITFFRNTAERAGEWRFEEIGPIDGLRLQGHSASPAVGDLDGDGVVTVLIGGEDGYFYHFDTPDHTRP
jgi:FG-GAP repeat.